MFAMLELDKWAAEEGNNIKGKIQTELESVKRIRVEISQAT